MKTILVAGNKTDVGRVRQINEDYFGAYHFPWGDLFIVCDGMGGHEGGEYASRLAVKSINEHFEKADKNVAEPSRELRIAVEEANQAIIRNAEENPHLKGMGSTVVILLVTGSEAFIAHVGDSRIYLVRGGSIHQVTKDHSLVQQMVDAGMITAAEARNHLQKNVIKKALGAAPQAEPDVPPPTAIFQGDAFLLCSDGLTGYLEDSELLQILQQYSPQEASVRLVDQANSRGGADNITVQVVRVKEGKSLPRTVVPKLKKPWRIAAGVAALLAVLALGYFGLAMLDDDCITATKKSSHDSTIIKIQSPPPPASAKKDSVINPDSTAKEIKMTPAVAPAQKEKAPLSAKQKNKKVNK